MNEMENRTFVQLLSDIRSIIEDARRSVYAGINAIQIDHNWKIGRRIVEDEQGGKIRAEYGKRTIAELSAHLCAEFGEGYSERNLREFRAFYTVFPDPKIWHTRVPNLTWSHFRLLMRVADPAAREWYTNETSNEKWSFRTLDRNISTQYYERLLLSQADRKPVIAEMKEKTGQAAGRQSDDRHRSLCGYRSRHRPLFHPEGERTAFRDQVQAQLAHTRGAYRRDRAAEGDPSTAVGRCRKRGGQAMKPIIDELLAKHYGFTR